MWCSTPHLGGQRSHGLGVGAVGKPLLPFGGARLPPVSLAPSCQKIFTENVLHRAHLVFSCAKPLRPAAYVVLDSTSRGAKVARTRGRRRWKAAPPFWGGASASRFSGTFLSKDIHRKRPAPGCTSVKTPYPMARGYGLQHMWCSTPHLGGQRSHGLGVGAVGKPLLPFGGARLPPVSLAPSCQKIFTENVLHRGALRLKPPILWPVATACSICGARLHISGGEGRTDSGLASLESRSSLLGGRVCLPFRWHLPVKRYSPKTSCTEHT